MTKGELMFQPYRTYSLAILWSIEVRDLQPLAGVLPGVPVDGDALARSAAARAATAEAWRTLREECVERLRGNAADADKVPARPSSSAAVMECAKCGYEWAGQACMEAHK